MTSAKPLFAALFAFAALTALNACTFSRTVVNPRYREYDLSWIEAGKTDWREVLNRFGPPLSAARPADALTARLSGRFLTYSSWDEKTTRFGTRYLFPFRWTDLHPVREILIEFDDQGKVKEVWETVGDTAWRPFGSPREPVSTLVTAQGWETR